MKLLSLLVVHFDQGRKRAGVENAVQLSQNNPNFENLFYEVQNFSMKLAQIACSTSKTASCNRNKA
jgi:hypothetical protein